MFSVLRLEADEPRVGPYVSAINSALPSAQGRIDRRGCVVADLSTEERHWPEHLAQVTRAIEALREVLTAAQAAGDRTVVDIALYPRSEFAEGVQMTIDSHRFPPDVLRLMAELGVILEVTITSSRF